MGEEVGWGYVCREMSDPEGQTPIKTVMLAEASIHASFSKLF
jgi:hypothetical protein